MVKKFKVWADSESAVNVPDNVEQYYEELDDAFNVACDLAHRHDYENYRAIFHVEDLEIEETIETCENLGEKYLDSVLSKVSRSPLLFFFKVGEVDRREIENCEDRKVLMKKCCAYYTLADFATDWNDSDDDGYFLPNVMDTWCQFSLPES